MYSISNITYYWIALRYEKLIETSFHHIESFIDLELTVLGENNKSVWGQYIDKYVHLL